MSAMVRFHLGTALRGRASLAALAGFALASAVVAIVGLGSFRQLGLRAVSPTAASIVNLALLLPTAQAAVLGALTVTTGREGGLYAMLRGRGMGEASLVVSTWLAVTIAGALTLVAGFAAVALVIAGNVPLGDMPVFLALLAVMVAAAGSAAAVGILVGALVRARLQAALVALGVWFLLAVGLDLVVVGLGVILRAGEPALLAATLGNPLQAARVLSFLVIDAEGGVLGPLGTYLDVRLGRDPAIAVLAVALATWCAAPAFLAARALRRRDL